jgi:hypothetical protein
MDTMTENSGSLMEPAILNLYFIQSAMMFYETEDEAGIKVDL